MLIEARSQSSSKQSTERAATAHSSATPSAFGITDSAARRIAYLRERSHHRDGPGQMKLRVEVSGGGCSGFQYSFRFDDQTNDADHLFEHLGIAVIVDECSLELLAGSVLDFVEELIGSSFQIRNPNATSACSCGNSFAI